MGYLHYSLMVPTRSHYGDASTDLAVADAGSQTGSQAALTLDDATAGQGITKGELFLLSVGAGVTVWGITRLLTSMFEKKKVG